MDLFGAFDNRFFTVGIEVWSGGTLLHKDDFETDGVTPHFFGISDDTVPITQIRVGFGDGAEHVDNVTFPSLAQLPDTDDDGIPDDEDNCVDTPNPGQEDADGDGVGDVCDNCVNTPNADQADGDGDGIGNVCEAEIDIKPGSDPNCFNSDGNGVIPVAILTTSLDDGDAADFDATQVDIPSLELDGQAVAIRGKTKIMCHQEDVDGDGDTDLVCLIEDEDGTYNPGDATGNLTGSLLDGSPINASDSICITQ